MPSTLDTIIASINANVNNYPNQAFQNNNLKTILLLMCQLLAGGTAGGKFFAGPFEYHSSDFSTSVNLPIPLLNGLNLIVEINGVAKLVKGTDWSDLAGGGVHFLIPGFDAVNNAYTIYVYIKGN